MVSKSRSTSSAEFLGRWPAFGTYAKVQVDAQEHKTKHTLGCQKPEHAHIKKNKKNLVPMAENAAWLEVHAGMHATRTSVDFAPHKPLLLAECRLLQLPAAGNTDPHMCVDMQWALEQCRRAH